VLSDRGLCDGPITRILPIAVCLSVMSETSTVGTPRRKRVLPMKQPLLADDIISQSSARDNFHRVLRPLPLHHHMAGFLYSENVLNCIF